MPDPARSGNTGSGERREYYYRVFEDGVFRPDAPLDLPEGSRVQLAVESLSRNPDATPALSIEERRGLRRRVAERMMRNPLPADAPRFKRDDMYDRD